MKLSSSSCVRFINCGESSIDDSDKTLEESENWLGDSSIIVEPEEVGVVVVAMVVAVVWLRLLM